MSDTPDTLDVAPEAFAEVPDFPMVDTTRAELQFNPFDWYWHFQDGTILNSRRYWLRLTPEDPDYIAFMAAGNPRINIPRDAAGNDSLDELQKQVLDHYGLHATLEHYAGGVRWMKVQEPVTLSFGGKEYRFQTDDTSSTKVSKAIQLGKTLEIRNGTGSFQTKWKTADGFTDVALGIADLETIGMAVGLHEVELFSREDAIVAAIRDGWTPDDVDAAFADEAPAEAATEQAASVKATKSTTRKKA